MMKTVQAAPADRSTPKPDPLRDRYGRIGIPALAAAARFVPVQKPGPAERPDQASERQIVAMD